MLRLRRVDGSGAADWRLSLDEVSTGARLVFASPEALAAHLRDQMIAAEGGDEVDAHSEPAPGRGDAPGAAGGTSAHG
jgi:hypothetical protein